MSDNILHYSELRDMLKKDSKRECAEIYPNDDLFAIGILDSFGIIRFIVSLEKHYNCTIPQEELIPHNLCSIQAISEMLHRLGVSSMP